MNKIEKITQSLSPELLARFAKIVGERNALTDPNSTAKLEPPPVQKAPPGSFRSAMSAGSAIQQAAEAAAASRGTGGGDFGVGPIKPNSNVQGAMDVLSDTMGVDFGPYLQRVLHDVKFNWYNLIPEVARPPLMKRRAACCGSSW